MIWRLIKIRVGPDPVQLLFLIISLGGYGLIKYLLATNVLTRKQANSKIIIEYGESGAPVNLLSMLSRMQVRNPASLCKSRDVLSGTLGFYIIKFCVSLKLKLIRFIQFSTVLGSLPLKSRTRVNIENTFGLCPHQHPHQNAKMFHPSAFHFLKHF